MKSQPISVRFPDEVARKLRRRGAGMGQATSGLVVQLVDEGLRMAEHPGVVFRDGPTGRRAGLASGPDVAEVIAVLHDLTAGERGDAIARTAKWLGLSAVQVRTAEAYYAAYPREVDERIGANEAAVVDAQQASEVRRRSRR